MRIKMAKKENEAKSGQKVLDLDAKSESPTKQVSNNKNGNNPIEELESLGKSVVSDINKGQNPRIELSVRGLSNVVYDKESKTLGLGEKTAQRFFFNVAH